MQTLDIGNVCGDIICSAGHNRNPGVIDHRHRGWLSEHEVPIIHIPNVFAG